MNYKKIDYLLQMKQIQRLPNVPHHRSYNILEHGFVVGMLFRWFASACDVPYDINVWDKVLMHDYLEAFTGDLNFVVKNLSEKTSSAWATIEKEVCDRDTVLNHYSDEAIKSAMTEEQHTLFKACDYLDLWIFCKQEEALGNTTTGNMAVIDNCKRLIYNLCGQNRKWLPIFDFMAKYRA